jgi:acyl-CoA reductase-like NAD-dependent aldehyde dehydrogenase
VDRAVKAARTAFEGREWGAAPPGGSRALAAEAGRPDETHAAEIAEIETIDNGKPLVISQRVTPSAVDFVRYRAGPRRSRAPP